MPLLKFSGNNFFSFDKDKKLLNGKHKLYKLKDEYRYIDYTESFKEPSLYEISHASLQSPLLFSDGCSIVWIFLDAIGKVE